jgi:hypothetical protein
MRSLLFVVGRNGDAFFHAILHLIGDVARIRVVHLVGLIHSAIGFPHTGGADKDQISSYVSRRVPVCDQLLRHSGSVMLGAEQRGDLE